MKYFDIFYPPKEERKHLGRFYLASFVSELFNVAQPFQFIFLFLVMEKPEWAIIPLIVEGLAVFILEIPAGIVADKFGRKLSVILGDMLSGIAWLAIPAALFLEGPLQLIVVCTIFAIEGLGQTLVSGAEEAWVVDNLISVKSEKMTDQYFAREKSVSSIGGALSGLTIWLVLTTTEVTTEVIAMLWIVSGIGQIISALMQLTIPEYRVLLADEKEDHGDVNLWKKIKEGEALRSIRTIFMVRPLLAFTFILLVMSFVTSITGDAFEISMLARELNPKDLAPLAVITDLIGIGTPMVAVLIARRVGAFNFLFVMVTLPAAAIFILFADPSLLTIIILYLFFNLVDDLWDPIADTVMHSYIPSAIRATTTSIINQFSELIGLLGLGVFALMLGEHSDKVQDAIPNLVEAFRGEKAEPITMPLSLFGLQVQDAALFLFTVSGLLAAAVLLIYPWNKEARVVDLGGAQQAPVPPVVPNGVSPQMQKRLVTVRKELDNLLEKYNPGEQLSWNVSATPYELPPDTISELKAIGPVLQEFFKAANTIFYKYKWVQQRLEKRITPYYHHLNRCQPDNLPRLIRPDIVCDQNWLPRLVEIETTVGARADTALMAKQFGLDARKSFVGNYAKIAKSYEAEGKNLALITAPHPFFQDLPDDAKAFASMLKENGVNNLIVITEENMASLRHDGRSLTINERFEESKTIHVIDRFIDIYEIAELQHAGIGAILDAYISGVVTDVNSIKQFLDEKDWMSLIWDPRLASEWERELGHEYFLSLKKWVPQTRIITPDLTIELANGETIPITDIGKVRLELRNFVIKESGTSSTASGSQAFYPLVKMSEEEIEEELEKILNSEVQHVLQDLIESPRVPYTFINPDNDLASHQPAGRFKISPFYLDGMLTDIRFVASDKKYAVNDDEDCLVSVVRYR